MGEIQKQEEKFLKWLHEKEKAESLDDSEFMKYLKLHVEGYHVPGWPRVMGPSHLYVFLSCVLSVFLFCKHMQNMQQYVFLP